jgi:hypothetical protein
MIPDTQFQKVGLGAPSQPEVKFSEISSDQNLNSWPGPYSSGTALAEFNVTAARQPGAAAAARILNFDRCQIDF